jgi:hypothetical protein
MRARRGGFESCGWRCAVAWPRPVQTLVFNNSPQSAIQLHCSCSHPQTLLLRLQGLPPVSRLPPPAGYVPPPLKAFHSRAISKSLNQSSLIQSNPWRAQKWRSGRRQAEFRQSSDCSSLVGLLIPRLATGPAGRGWKRRYDI